MFYAAKGAGESRVRSMRDEQKDPLPGAQRVVYMPRFFDSGGNAAA